MAGSASTRDSVRQLAIDASLPPLFWLANLIVPRLPRACVTAVAWFAGVIGGALCPGYLRKVVEANLKVAFGDGFSRRQRKRILAKSLANFSLVVLDLFWFSRNTARRIERYVDYDSSVDTLGSSLPIIGVTAHYGNWELLGRAFTARFGNLTNPIADLPHPLAQDLLARLRSDPKLQLVPRVGAARLLLAALRAGNSAGLVMDQNTPLGRGGDFVKLFGLPVAASTTAAVLARRTGRPIVPLFCVPEKRGRYRVYAGPAIACADDRPLSREQIDSRVTQAVLKGFEEQIRRRPELWFWTYRRWKFIPFGACGKSKHPFYASDMILPKEFSRAMRLDAIRNRARAA